MDFDDLDEVAAERAADGDDAALAAMGAPEWEGVKIYYWPAVGRNRAIQLCLAELGVPWEDVHWGVENMDNAEMRKEFFFKCQHYGGGLVTNCPMLELNGKFYTQSSAILRFVSRRGGLYPSDKESAYIVDNIIAASEDLRAACYTARGPFGAKDRFLAELPNHLGTLKRLLGKEETFLPGNFTVADIAVFDVLHTFVEGQVPGQMEKFPTLTSFCKRVAARPLIHKYLDSAQARVLFQVQAI